MIALTDVEIDLLRKCAAGGNITSSDRPGDRARTHLKKIGFLVFERSYWRWRVTDAGKEWLDTIAKCRGAA